MKTNILVLFALLSSLQLYAKEIQCLPEGRIEIRGDSTVRKFSAEAKKFDVTGKAKEKPVSQSIMPWTPAEIEISMPVKNLKASSEKLETHMWENLKIRKFPLIQLKLTKFSFKEAFVAAFGTLSVAGVTKEIELNGLISVTGNKINVSGAKTLLMTDFGIEPPTMMLGALKTKNEIEVKFEVNCLLDSNKKE